MNRSGSATVKDNFKCNYAKATRCLNSQIYSTIPLPILKNLTITPVSKIPDDTPKIVRELGQSKEPLGLSNLNISKEITTTKIHNVENSIMLLKKLPNITFHVINPEPVFKIPESPTLNKVFKKKVLSERQNTNIINKNENSKLFNNTESISGKNSIFQKLPICKHKPGLKPIDNITTLKKKNSDTIISKSLEKIPKKNSYSEIKDANTQKTSFPIRCLKKSLSFSDIKIKNLQTINPVKKPTNFDEEKTVLVNSSTINNVENKTYGSANKNDMFMDLSSKDQTNISSASYSLDFINVSLPKYDTFVMGINKFPGESKACLETFQNHIDKQELRFSNHQNDIDSSLSTNKLNDAPKNFVTQSTSITESTLLDSIKTDEIYVTMKQLENEQKGNLYIDNNINHTTDSSTVNKDIQFLQEMRSLLNFGDEVIENTSEIEIKSMDCTKPDHESLFNNAQETFMEPVEYKTGIKRSQPQNMFNKKQKPDDDCTQ